MYELTSMHVYCLRPPSCHVSQVEKMQEEIAALNSELLSLKAAHENEILSLKGDFQKELKDLKEEHKETIHTFQARHVEMNVSLHRCFILWGRT